MVDLETPDFQLIEPVAGQQRAVCCPFRTGLAEHPPGLEEAPDRRIRRQRRSAADQGGAEVVEMQLRGPARMLTVLGRQAVDGRRREAREAADIAAQAVLQGRHRIFGGTGRVVPALERRGAETDVEAGARMPPCLGGECGQGGGQFPRRRRCGEQWADDREAQARPTIPLRWIEFGTQEGLPVRRRRRRRGWE